MSAWVLLAVIVIVAFVAVLWGVGIYNRLVTLKNRFQNAFSQIEVQLKRRYDLIPNLVETVKGYMQHERGTLEAVIRPATRPSAAWNGRRPIRATRPPCRHWRRRTGLSGALGRLFALAEAYPDLKANQNMAQLSEEITSTENKVAFARQAYNDAVTRLQHLSPDFPARGVRQHVRPQPGRGAPGFRRCPNRRSAESVVHLVE